MMSSDHSKHKTPSPSQFIWKVHQFRGGGAIQKVHITSWCAVLDHETDIIRCKYNHPLTKTHQRTLLRRDPARSSPHPRREQPRAYERLKAAPGLRCQKVQIGGKPHPSPIPQFEGARLRMVQTNSEPSGSAYCRTTSSATVLSNGRWRKRR